MSRDEALEADLKSLLYYFRHHTVEPEILKRLCFVEIVYSLQNHANRCNLEFRTMPISALWGSHFILGFTALCGLYDRLPSQACTTHDIVDHC